MSTLLLRPLLRPQLLFAACAPIGLGLGLSLYTYHQFHTSQHWGYKLDGGIASVDSAGAGYSYTKDARAPVVTREGTSGRWRLNPKAVRQVSFGSITGLCAGLLVSSFSKSLALILGLLVVGVQWAGSYGINVVPYKRLQKYVSGIDLRSAVQDNAAAKVSFGVTFAMAGFMSF